MCRFHLESVVDRRYNMGKVRTSDGNPAVAEEYPKPVVLHIPGDGDGVEGPPLRHDDEQERL